MAKPLTNLTQNEAVWPWGDAEAKSFMVLKIALATAPVLHLPDFENQFVVTTDMSDPIVGAILE